MPQSKVHSREIVACNCSELYFQITITKQSRVREGVHSQKATDSSKENKAECNMRGTGSLTRPTNPTEKPKNGRKSRTIPPLHGNPSRAHQIAIPSVHEHAQTHLDHTMTCDLDYSVVDWDIGVGV